MFVKFNFNFKVIVCSSLVLFYGINFIWIKNDKWFYVYVLRKGWICWVVF